MKGEKWLARKGGRPADNNGSRGDRQEVFEVFCPFFVLGHA